MTEEFIDYGKLIDESMRDIVRRTLKIAEENGLKNDHHFFITFQTRHAGVMISDKLVEKYPDEMTIILQHQFWDLEVDKEKFNIVLSFDNVKESLSIPFEALTSFADPSVKFGLQFRRANISANDQSGEEKKTTKKKGRKTAGSKGGDSNVVALDNFRKKK